MSKKMFYAIALAFVLAFAVQPSLAFNPDDWQNQMQIDYNDSASYVAALNTSAPPIPLNGSDGIDIDGQLQSIWIRAIPNSTFYVYFNSSTAYTVTNSTNAEIAFYVENGTADSNASLEVYSGTGAIMAMHMTALNSATGDVGTITPTGGSNVSGFAGFARDIDGNPDTIEITDNANWSTYPLSYLSYYNPDTLGSQWLIGQEDAGPTFLFLRMLDAAGRMRLSAFDGTGTDNCDTASGGDGLGNLSVNQYHQVGGTINGTGTNEANVYINGNNVKTCTIDDSPNVGSALGIGKNPASTTAADGQIDYAAMFNRALTSEEYKMHYNAVFNKGVFTTFDVGDDTPPTVTLLSPGNITTNVQNQSVESTADEMIDVWTRELNEDNATFLPNTTVLGAEGTNILIIYANDSSGNVGSDKVVFTLDTTDPVIVIDAPQNTTLGAENQSISISYTEVRPDKFWYINDSGAAVFFTPNTTGLFPDGFHNFTVHMNDTAGNSARADVNFTIDSRVPFATQLFPSNNTLDNDNLTVNFTIIDDNGGHINITLYINGEINQTAENISNNTLVEFNVSFVVTQQVNWSLLLDDGLNQNQTGNFSFKYDVDSPEITWTLPLFDNSSARADEEGINLTLDVEDSNLFRVNISVYYANGSRIFNRYEDGINDTNLTIRDFVNWSLDPDQVFTVNISATDDHTAKTIPDYEVTEDLMERSLLFDTGSNEINVVLEDAVVYNSKSDKPNPSASLKNDILNFKAKKNTDRYIFEIDFDDTGKKNKYYDYQFMISSIEPLVYRPNSNYMAHFVSGNNWIDFETNNSDEWKVQKINDTAYLINISTFSTNLTFNSIGGVNQINQSASITKDTTDPVMVIDAPQNASLTSQNQSLNINYTELNPDKFWYVINSNATQLFVPNTTFTADIGFNNLTVYMNDTTGHNASISVNFTVEVSEINITNVRTANITDDSIDILWETTASTNSTIHYDIVQSVANVTTDAQNVTAHSLKLENLFAGSFYYFNVTSCRSDGACNTSAQFLFETKKETGTSSGSSSSSDSDSTPAVLANESSNQTINKTLELIEGTGGFIGIEFVEESLAIVSLEGESKEFSFNLKNLFSRWQNVTIGFASVGQADSWMFLDEYEHEITSFEQRTFTATLQVPEGQIRGEYGVVIYAQNENGNVTLPVTVFVKERGIEQEAEGIWDRITGFAFNNVGGTSLTGIAFTILIIAFSFAGTYLGRIAGAMQPAFSVRWSAFVTLVALVILFVGILAGWV